MNNKRATKRALLTSVMALVMCVVMLVGTTFAWFTDTASTGVNKIQAGNLDIEMEYKNNTTGGEFKPVDTDKKVFNEEALWEPGHVEYVVLKISNAGNLALKYKLGINIASETGSTNVLGNAFNLSDYIRFAVLDGDKTVVSGGTEFKRETLMDDVTDTNSKLIKAGYTSKETRLYPEVTPAVAGQASEKVVTLVVWMPKSVGNEANYDATAAEAPVINLGINVAATQDTVESDSFNNEYDKNAVYPIVAMDTLQELINNAAEPVSAKLEGNIAGSLTVPQDKNVTLDLNGFTLTGGDSHAILNRGKLCIKDSSGDGKIVASKAETSALRNGDGAVCVIEGGTFTRTDAEGNKWHTVENFGAMTFNGGKVIAEDGQSFAIVNGWNYIPVPGEQKATMTINNIDMKAGPSGLKNCAGGTLTMNGGTLHCTGYWGLSNVTGVATINGGEITSDTYIAISNGGTMEINGGTFTGPRGSLYVQTYAQETVVKGGSYQNETEEFMQGCCPDGYTAKLEGGMVVVSKN